ncbi:MAG: 2-oxoacid:ferredoxin oxidoreductase subunit beta [Pseudomonadales bacterium]|nr:2-oxoacid:ferredoxin oxidoreductase subunit beta [Pseudomonadales bacterium]
MSYSKPKFRHPDLPTNELGLTKSDYEGAISTLCAGCGHDSISASILNACFEMSIQPHRVAKLSGIGCSSKSPAYFLGKSHGFNSVHGRMPSVATGANLANRDLIYIGISGDGDSASIGLGQFMHVVRRNLNMLYVVENNGCYGLTKGQDSATADLGSATKKGIANPYEPMDLVSLALQIGATFVARSFSGDKRQLEPLIKAAITHKGFALIDVISPCVTFNNSVASTKGYQYVREHMSHMAVDFVPMREEICTSYQAGTTQQVCMHDGSAVHLHKTGADFDIHDRHAAMEAVYHHKQAGEILTGLLYMAHDSDDLHEVLGTVSKPLNALTENELCPGSRFLDSINEGLR